MGSQNTAITVDAQTDLLQGTCTCSSSTSKAPQNSSREHLLCLLRGRVLASQQPDLKRQRCPAASSVQGRALCAATADTVPATAESAAAAAEKLGRRPADAAPAGIKVRRQHRLHNCLIHIPVSFDRLHSSFLSVETWSVHRRQHPFDLRSPACMLKAGTEMAMDAKVQIVDLHKHHLYLHLHLHLHLHPRRCPPPPPAPVPKAFRLSILDMHAYWLGGPSYCRSTIGGQQ